MYWGVLAEGRGVIAGSGLPNISCFLFQGLLSQLGITHLRKDVPAWATDCHGDKKPAKEVTSQFKTWKNCSGQVEGRALGYIQVFPSQFQGKTENPNEHGAPLLVEVFPSFGRSCCPSELPKTFGKFLEGFSNCLAAQNSLLAHYFLLPRIHWILVTIIQRFQALKPPYKQFLGADAKPK